jgi:hypothetical protein
VSAGCAARVTGGAAMQNVIITYAETNPSTEKLTKLTTGSCCCIVLMTCIARSTRRVPPRIAISNLECASLRERT